MSGYALNMLMKRDLCATISNLSGYVIVRESGRSNRAPKVARSQQMRRQAQPRTTRENPSSSAGFEAISSAGTRSTNKALQLTVSSSAICTRATTIDYISSAFPKHATIS